MGTSKIDEGGTAGGSDHMPAQDVALSARLGRAERSIRIWQVLTVMVMLFTAWHSLTGRGNARASIINANRFCLQDASGNERGFLGFMPGVGASKAGLSTAPTLALCDSAGRIRTAVRVADDGQAALVFFDESGKERAAYFDKGLSFMDEEGVPRICLGLMDLLAGMLDDNIVQDVKNGLRADISPLLASAKSESPTMMMSSPNGTSQVTLAAENGHAAIRMAFDSRSAIELAAGEDATQVEIAEGAVRKQYGAK